MRIGIQQKLGAVVLVLMGISFGIIALSFSGLETLRDVADTGAKYFAEFTTISQLQLAIEKEATPVKLFLISESEGRYDEFTRSNAEVHRLLRTLERDPTIHKLERAHLARIIKYQNNLESLARDVFESEEDISKSEKIATGRKVRANLMNVERHVAAWRKLDTAEVKRSLLKADTVQGLERQLLISSLVILLIGVLVSLSVAQFISKPILALHKGVEHIDKGGLEYVSNIKTRDEIQDLAEAFGRLVQNLRREEQTGAEIQQRLLPQKKLRARGVGVHAKQTAARVVGGDWYDYYRHKDEIRFMVADASGRGIPGALLATVGMTAIRAERKATATIEEILTKANQTITKRFGGADFITIFSAQLSLRDHRLQYINCGHEPPLYFNAKDDVWDILPCRAGFPIGISLEIFDPTPQEIILNPGDKILLYTDGVHSVRDKDSKFFSISQISAWLNEHRGLSVELLMDELLAKVIEYNDGPLTDDVTLLGIEMTQIPEEDSEDIAEILDDGETNKKTTA